MHIENAAIENGLRTGKTLHWGKGRATFKGLSSLTTSEHFGFLVVASLILHMKIGDQVIRHFYFHKTCRM